MGQVVCLIVWGHFHDYGFLYLFVLPSYLLAKALLRAGLLSEEGYATIVISLILIFIFYLLYLEIWYYTHFWGARAPPYEWCKALRQPNSYFPPYFFRYKYKYYTRTNPSHFFCFDFFPFCSSFALEVEAGIATP